MVNALVRCLADFSVFLRTKVCPAFDKASGCWGMLYVFCILYLFWSWPLGTPCSPTWRGWNICKEMRKRTLVQGLYHKCYFSRYQLGSYLAFLLSRLTLWVQGNAFSYQHMPSSIQHARTFSCDSEVHEPLGQLEASFCPSLHSVEGSCLQHEQWQNLVLHEDFQFFL